MREEETQNIEQGSLTRAQLVHVLQQQALGVVPAVRLAVRHRRVRRRPQTGGQQRGGEPAAGAGAQRGVKERGQRAQREQHGGPRHGAHGGVRHHQTQQTGGSTRQPNLFHH